MLGTEARSHPPVSQPVTEVGASPQACLTPAGLPESAHLLHRPQACQPGLTAPLRATRFLWLGDPISAVPNGHARLPNPSAHAHVHRHTHTHTVINSEAQASFQSRDHIAKVRDTDRQEKTGAGLGGGAGKKKSVAKDTKKMKFQTPQSTKKLRGKPLIRVFIK